MPFLVWDSPQGRAVHSLERALVVIGRDAGCDVVLEHPTVSRRHVLVQVEDRVKITDLRSTAGTRINGAKLKPDVPCTLEPGDFLEVGKVVLSFHVAAPPAPATPPAAGPRVATPRAKQQPPPWRALGIGLAFVAVAVAGALLAFEDRKEPRPASPVAEVARQPTEAQKPEPPPPPAVEETPAPAPPPKLAEPERAAAGELPPRAPAPELPDLIEVDRTTHHPARIRSFGGSEVEALGADGRIYAIPMSRVTKVEDRVDLARRVGVERRRLAPKDVAARVALAEWCAERLLLDEAKALVREALSLEPEDKGARALKARLEERE